MYRNENLRPHTVLLHDAEKLDDDLRGWSDQDLSLSGLLGVVDGIERIVLNSRSSQPCLQGEEKRELLTNTLVFTMMED
jgi:hypothetical protein